MKSFKRSEIESEADQTQACKSLLASVVWIAINDGATAPIRRSRDGLPMGHDAFTAMRFLFDETVSGLNEYANWLDFDAGQFRTRLRETMANQSPHMIGGFEPIRRRHFRQNYGMWLQLRDGYIAQLPEDDE